MLRIGEDDFYSEIKYEYTWLGTEDEIRKIETTANRIIAEPKIADSAEEWTITSKKSYGDCFILCIDMSTLMEGYGNKENVEDWSGGEYKYFEKIVRRIEDESGVKFEA